jgi:hypothetical protein
MTASTLDPPLSHLPPIALTDLTDRAELHTRTDRKYVLSLSETTALLSQLRPDTQVLQIASARSFRYESVYFDTPDLTSFRLTAYRRRRRFKIRTRTYLDSALCWLEVKTPGLRGETVKNRLPYLPRNRTTVLPGRSFVDAVLATLAIANYAELAFAPTLVTRYRRSTLFVPATASRATIDTDLAWEDSDGHCLRLPHIAVVETKTGSAASHVDQLLWARGHRPTCISKYATGLAAMRPDLPAAPWRRTLRRHFALTTPPADEDLSGWATADPPISWSPASWFNVPGVPDGHRRVTIPEPPAGRLLADQRQE